MTDKADPQWRPSVAQALESETFRPLSASVALEVGAASMCGAKNEHNTDHYLVIRTGRMQETLTTSLAAADLPPPFEEYAYALLVADGMGKHGAGTRASRVALSALAHVAIRFGKWNVRVGAETAAEITAQGDFFYRRVNDAVLRARWGEFHLTDMATSLTALYIAESDLFFAHVGHSRAFLFRHGLLTQLTTDHTLQQQRRTAGPSALEGASSDLSHVVTETIGGRASGPIVQIEHVRLASGDRLLLCTNGLTDVVTDDQIADTLALQRRPSDDCHRLLDLARAAGSPDDVTALVADYRVRAESRRAA
jgi:PPM family protein phosphatase